MSNLRYWSLPSVLLSVLVASAAAHDANQEKKTETEKQPTAVNVADMFQFSGRQHMVIPSLRYDGSHPITFEAIVVTLYRGSIIGDFNGSGLGLDAFQGFTLTTNQSRVATIGIGGSLGC